MKVRITKHDGRRWYKEIGAVYEVEKLGPTFYFLADNQGFGIRAEDCEPVRDERDEVLEKLAGFEYPRWCEWVSVDAMRGADVWAWDKKPLANYKYFINPGTDLVARIRREEFCPTTPLLYSISEIRARQERLNGSSFTKQEARQYKRFIKSFFEGSVKEQPTIAANPLPAKFDWERPDFRATVMANVGYEEPRQYVCRPIPDVINCGCGLVCASPQELQKHLRDKTGELFPISLILEKFKK